MVAMTLLVLQTMTFILRIDFSIAKQGYGGTVKNEKFSYRQGNGMAPSGFTCVSVLMSNSYRMLDHGSALAGAW